MTASVLCSSVNLFPFQGVQWKEVAKRANFNVDVIIDTFSNERLLFEAG